MSVNFDEFSMKSVACWEGKKYLDIHGVRITPPFIEFKDAFEGRTYKQKLSIQNVGKTTVFVRLTPPSSFAYKIKSVKGHHLSPGLCIVREVTYNYTYASAPVCMFDIYIGDNRIDYYIFAKPSAPEIALIPKAIDFGLVDTEVASPTRILVLRNDGSKPTRFYVDAGNSPHKIISEPFKGVVQPRSSTHIHVKVISSIVGSFHQNLWITCDKPYIVPLSGEVIRPKFEPIYDSPGMGSIVVVDFPATYVGTTSAKVLYIKNHSASDTMFCIMGEVHNNILDLKTCVNMEPDFGYFDVSPKGGMTQSKEVKVFNFRFKPLQPRHDKTLKPFYICIYHIIRVKCKYLMSSVCIEESYASEDMAHAERMSRSSSGMFDHLKGVQTAQFLRPSAWNRSDYHITARISDSLEIYLHGIAEEPSITVIPDELNLADLTVGERYVRVLEFKNNSRRLSIIMDYKKVAYVDVDKEKFSIDAKKSLQISVFITPHQIGKVKTRVYFHLSYYDESGIERTCKIIGKVVVPLVFEAKSVKKSPLPQINKGLTPNYIKEVGKFCQDVKFNTQVDIPKCTLLKANTLKKDDSALIAFPNDRQRSLRPWRANAKVKTLFTKTSRYTPPIDADYEMTIFGRKLKTEISNYYTTYTRKQAEKMRASKNVIDISTDYDLTDDEKLMCRDCRLLMPCGILPSTVEKIGYFIPLTPIEMNNVIIEPLIIDAGRIAMRSRYNFELRLKNKNSFPLRFYVKSEKPNMIFPDGNGKKVKACGEAILPIIYMTAGTGYYTTFLNVIVNDSSLYIVTVMADVVTPHLDVNTDVLEFYEEDIRFIEITNPLNKAMKFKWSMVCNNFQIEPGEGLIKPKMKQCCQVQYLADQHGQSMVDADLFASEFIVQQIKLCVKTESIQLHFVPDQLHFPDSPLNMPVYRKTMLKNNSQVPISFSLIESDFLRYAHVNPMQDIIYGNSYVIICVTLTITSCVEFSTKLKFHVSGSGLIELPLDGNVVYPDVIVRPSILKFNRVPSSTVGMVQFSVENRSKALALVKFDMSMYIEYKVTDTKHYWEREVIEEVLLEKHTSKILFMHFIPKASVTDKFFLPLNINHILGPTISDNVVTGTEFYLKDKIPDSRPVAIPNVLPLIRIHSFSSEPQLKFSKLLVNLNYALTPFPYKNTYNLRISNILQEEETFCIRTSDLVPPFYMTPISGKKVEMHPKSMVCRLSYKEEVVFNVCFKPDQPGYYRIALPVFLRSELSEKPHNTLCINGVFEIPTITVRTDSRYYKPAPVGVRNTCSIVYDLHNHFPNCSVHFKAEMRQTDVQITDCPTDYPHKRVVSVSLICQTDVVGIDSCNFTLLCTCGSSNTIILIGCRDNCFLTNYAQVYTFIRNTEYNLEKKTEDVADLSIYRKISLMSTIDAPPPLKEIFDQDSFFIDYPFFPKSSDDDFSIFMNKTVSAVEDWMHMGGFFGRNFYKIPSGISYTKYGTSSIQPIFVQLLINLAGDQLKDYFDLCIITDEVEWVEYLYKTYKTALEFLRGLGAYFTYISPELLMSYSFYKIYTENHVNDDPNKIYIADRDQFYLLAKQCWLDVLLQTYKVLVLQKLLFGKNNVYVAPSIKSEPHEKYMSSIKNLVRNKHLFSNTELLLLNWLEFHYNDIRARVWTNNTFLWRRDITWYGEHMEDGFVYAAVTLAYCPYVSKHFEDLHSTPSTVEEFLHNTIKVIQCWRMLNFNCKVNATDLVTPNPTKTLFVIVYLYQVLPNMYPSEVIEFDVGLSKYSKKRFVLKNVYNFPIAYKAILYGNDDNCFETDQELYVVQPKGSCKIEICYWAKFIKRSQCTLILSGECKGYKYAKSVVITLIGNPDVRHVTASFDLAAVLYQLEKASLAIQSPYLRKATYQIQFTCDDVATIEDVDKLLFVPQLPKYFLTRLLPLQIDCEFDENGKASLDFLLCILSPRIVPTRVFFRNPEVGDFCVMINTTRHQAFAYEILVVALPTNWDEVKVSRKMKKPSIIMQVPCQNKLKWKTITEYCLRVGKEDGDFWKEHSRSLMGLHILQSIIKFSMPTLQKFCGSMKYYFDYPKNCGVKFPKFVEVNDKCCTALVDVPIEIINPQRIPDDFFIVMASEDGLELRHYQLQFVLCD